VWVLMPLLVLPLAIPAVIFGAAAIEAAAAGLSAAPFLMLLGAGVSLALPLAPLAAGAALRGNRAGDRGLAAGRKGAGRRSSRSGEDEPPPNPLPSLGIWRPARDGAARRSRGRAGGRLCGASGAGRPEG